MVSSSVAVREKLDKYKWKKRATKPLTQCWSSIGPRVSLTTGKIQRPQKTTPAISSACMTTPSITNPNVNSYVIVSIVEGRGSSTGEIGIASLDLNRPNIELSQFCDTSSYSRTLVKLLVLNPNLIIVPHSSLEPSSCMQKLVRVLQGFRTSSPVIGVYRGRFNDRQGLCDLRRLCHPVYLASIYAIRQRFYALAATSALFHYAEEAHGRFHAPRSLKFSFTGSLQTTMIDLKSACRLELVDFTGDTKASKSLYAAINFTCTVGGSRLLRANILEPPCDLPTILQRQDAITELAKSPELLVGVQNVLRQFPNIDGLLSLCVQICSSPNTSLNHNTPLTDGTCTTRIPVDKTSKNENDITKSNSAMPRTGGCDQLERQMSIARNSSAPSFQVPSTHRTEPSFIQGPASLQAAECRTTRVIGIKSMLDLVPRLHKALGGVKSSLLRTYKDLLSDPGYDAVLRKLCTVLHSDVRMSKGLLAMRSQKCFAIKEGISVILDVTRRAYSEQLDDVTAEVSRLSKKHGLPLRVAHNKVRGFYIQIPEAALTGNEGRESAQNTSVSLEDDSGNRDFGDPWGLDEIPVHKVAETDTWENSSQSEIQNQTDSTSARCKNYSRTQLPKEFIKVCYSKSLIHCTTETLSGKSAYLRQVAYFQILAQVGSMVPAEFATVRTVDQIFYHTSGADDLLFNESSFTREMKGMSYLLRQSTNKSLVLIDGLCQSTNQREAIHLMWAICEALLQSKAFTFLATQNNEITQLAKSYPNVENCHFLVHVESVKGGNRVTEETDINWTGYDNTRGDDSICQSSTVVGELPFGRTREHNNTLESDGVQLRSKVTFTYRLVKGVAVKQKGLALMSLNALPIDVLRRAEELMEELTSGISRAQRNQETGVSQTVTCIPKCSVSSWASEPIHRTGTLKKHMDPNCWTEPSFLTDNSSPTGINRVSQATSSTCLRENDPRNMPETTLDMTDRLRFQLLRQMSILAKPITQQSNIGTPNDGMRPHEKELLMYIRFLKNRYRAVIKNTPNPEE
ncbi:MutS domain V protein [Opisthorchis viverrini]|uniref:MutS domain V protein n=1 Tax=Opisthorchis viverrini TaxID=6198 RepID=A0A1S8WJU5_OPIVI|nr:MutS domain V protein [Opisthorchis viverrini]